MWEVASVFLGWWFASVDPGAALAGDQFLWPPVVVPRPQMAKEVDHLAGWVRGRQSGHTAEMSESESKHTEPVPEVDEPPNLRPGPSEQGGHGGMATREQEERLYEEQHPDKA